MSVANCREVVLRTEFVMVCMKHGDVHNSISEVTMMRRRGTCEGCTSYAGGSSGADP